MGLFLFLIGIGLFVALFSETFLGWLIATGLAGLFTSVMFAAGGYFDDPPPKAPVKQEKKVEEVKKETPPPPDNPDTNQTKAQDPPPPPKPEHTDDRWAKFADAAFNGEGVITVCHDGVQYQMSAWIYDTNDNNGVPRPDVVVAWPRIHPDGKPFTCSENKDPTQEVNK